MLTDQSDEKGTLPLIGKFLAYHNLITKLCNLKFGSRKKAPSHFQQDLIKEKDTRDRLCHDIWEVIHSNIHSLNEGPPEWSITHEEFIDHIDFIKDLHSRIVRSPEPMEYTRKNAKSCKTSY